MSDERKKAPARTRRTPAPTVPPAPKAARATKPAARKPAAPPKPRARAAKAKIETAVELASPVPEPEVAAVVAAPQPPAIPDHEVRELISRRATEIWLSHGGMAQGSIEDWLQAESEVRRTLEHAAS